MNQAMIRACLVALAIGGASGAWAQGVPLSPDSASALVASNKADKKLAEDVRSAVSGASVDTSRVKIVVRHGAVTLRGSVPDRDQIQAASEAAAQVDGVASVKNKLKSRQ
ncbi:BON domain-containing protein [Paraburkholderia unamae]|uniref:BON domain-containing protein n=1 Tax=Paraburkholderia unamae TaxID=219649 RepID=A0ABX5KDB5_9BURK|nr:BON domain-containing protein [Paraburkholderia unamae]PVX75111.1 BON domain-containing protein [Paraburkholderia unamae]CAG9257284.1 BON domain-containing protein [Paraburkholderia unamae]